MMFRVITSFAYLVAITSAQDSSETQGLFGSIFSIFFPPRYVETTWKVKVTNLAYDQPLAPTFVLIHDDTVPPVFELGGVATVGLKDLAEGGSPAALIAQYAGLAGTRTAVGEADPVPIGIGVPPGLSREFMVTTSTSHPYVSMASMLIHTNDCFAGFNKMMPKDGMVIMTPGYDSGTEDNDEDCNHIPGPDCGGEGTNAGGEGEGYIHVHRGIHGGGDLMPSRHDWRNPVMVVEFTKM